MTFPSRLTEQHLHLAGAALVFVAFVQLSDALKPLTGPITLNTLSVSMALLLLLVSWRTGRTRLVRSPVIGWMLAYAAAIGLSAALSDSRAAPPAELVSFGHDLLLVFVIVNLIASWSGLRLGMWAMIAAGCTLSILALASLATGDTFGGLAHAWSDTPIAGGLYGVRIGGPTNEPTIFAQQLVIVLPLAMCCVWVEHQLALRLVALAAVGLMCWALILTFSRGGFLGLMVALACTAVLCPGIRIRWALWFGALFVLVVVAVPAGYGQRLETLASFIVGASDGDGSLQFRSRSWRVGGLMALGHPLVGVGVGNYSAEWPSYVVRINRELPADPQAAQLPLEPQGAHMVLVRVAAETGLAGLVTLAGAVVAAIVSVRHIRRSATDVGPGGARDIAAALEAALYGYLVTSLFLDGQWTRDFWLLVALAAAAGQRASAGSRFAQLGRVDMRAFLPKLARTSTGATAPQP